MANAQKALQSSLRDLPQRYPQRPGQWVAYPGDRQTGFAHAKPTLYQHCFDEGLRRADFVVFCIEPRETGQVI